MRRFSAFRASFGWYFGRLLAELSFMALMGLAVLVAAAVFGR